MIVPLISGWPRAIFCVLKCMNRILIDGLIIGIAAVPPATSWLAPSFLTRTTKDGLLASLESQRIKQLQLPSF